MFNDIFLGNPSDKITEWIYNNQPTFTKLQLNLENFPEQEQVEIETPDDIRGGGNS